MELTAFDIQSVGRLITLPHPLVRLIHPSQLIRQGGTKICNEVIIKFELENIHSERQHKFHQISTGL